MTAILRVQLIQELTGRAVVKASQADLARALTCEDEPTRALAELVIERRRAQSQHDSTRTSE